MQYSGLHIITENLDRTNCLFWFLGLMSDQGDDGQKICVEDVHNNASRSTMDSFEMLQLPLLLKVNPHTFYVPSPL